GVRNPGLCLASLIPVDPTLPAGDKGLSPLGNVAERVTEGPQDTPWRQGVFSGPPGRPRAVPAPPCRAESPPEASVGRIAAAATPLTPPAEVHREQHKVKLA